jgi:hypothetical protein
MRKWPDNSRSRQKKRKSRLSKGNSNSAYFNNSLLLGFSGLIINLSKAFFPNLKDI